MARVCLLFIVLLLMCLVSTGERASTQKVWVRLFERCAVLFWDFVQTKQRHSISTFHPNHGFWLSTQLSPRRRCEGCWFETRRRLLMPRQTRWSCCDLSCIHRFRKFPRLLMPQRCRCDLSARFHFPPPLSIGNPTRSNISATWGLARGRFWKFFYRGVCRCPGHCRGSRCRKCDNRVTPHRFDREHL